jgi:hypothetical protein
MRQQVRVMECPAGMNPAFLPKRCDVVCRSTPLPAAPPTTLHIALHTALASAADTLQAPAL